MPTISSATFPLAIHRLPPMHTQVTAAGITAAQLPTAASVITSSKGFVMPQAVSNGYASGQPSAVQQEVSSTENGGSKMVVKIEGANGVGK